MTPGSSQPTIYVVDDDPAVRKSLSRLLRAKGWNVETFESAEAVLAGRGPLPPGCLVLDVALPGLDGLELQRRLAQTGKTLPIVFLTGHGDIPMTVRAIKEGAADFLTKPVRAAALLRAVQAAVERDAAARLEGEDAAELKRRFESLTVREREVLAAVASGKLNKQIAGDLRIVEQTVKFHRARIMQRMQARTAAELMHIAAKLGVGKKSPVSIDEADPESSPKPRPA